MMFPNITQRHLIYLRYGSPAAFLLAKLIEAVRSC